MELRKYRSAVEALPTYFTWNSTITRSPRCWPAVSGRMVIAADCGIGVGLARGACATGWFEVVVAGLLRTNAQNNTPSAATPTTDPAPKPIQRAVRGGGG